MHICNGECGELTGGTYACIHRLLLLLDGYDTSEIGYSFKDGGNKAVKVEATNLPQFEMNNFTTERVLATTSTGNYVRLKIHLLFIRASGFYMMNIYTPSILIVIISWVSFWLSREAAPARVALGVTTVLTMTTLTTTTNASMPKVAYVKAIDYYLGFCFFMVFASLLEYAAVSYLSKKLVMRKEKKRARQKQEIQQPVEFSMFQPSRVTDTSVSPSVRSAMEDPMSIRYRGIQHPHYQLQHQIHSSPTAAIYTGRQTSPQPTMSLSTAGLMPSIHQHSSLVDPTLSTSEVVQNTGVTKQPYLDEHLECDCDIQTHHSHAQVALMPIKMPKMKRRRHRPFMTVGVPSPSIIDKYSRIVFPLVFTVFNGLYWVWLKIRADSKRDINTYDNQ